MKGKPYPKYKPTGVEWLGEVPEHWKVKRIGHNTYVKGRIGWQGLTADEFIDAGPFCVTGTDFINGKVNWKTSYHVLNERYQEDPYIQLKEGDLLITKDGTIGKTAVVIGLIGKATLNSGIFLTRPLNHTYSTLFMYWVLNSKVFIDFIDLSKTGTTISHLYQNVFVRFKFPLPPLPEQRTIAAFLDRETGRIDELIGKKKKLVELLKEKRMALISRAVTKGLNPNVKMKESGVDGSTSLTASWLGEVPEHWGVKRLRYVVSMKSGEGITSEEIDDNGVYPVYGGNGLRGYFSDYTHEGHYVLIGRQGALCGNINYGKGKFWASEHAVVANPNNPISTIWLGELLRIMNLNQYSVSAAQPGLAIDKIKELPIPLPPLPEQQAIAAFLDHETAKIDTLVSKVETVIEKLKEYRTALISAAVTGKIDVREAV
jgi:type I restriction enzyme S subunit